MRWAYSAECSATEPAPGSKAFGASIEVPPVLPRLRRSVAASLTPPLDDFHSSVWSSTQNTGRLPSRLVGAEVTYSIRPFGRLTKDSIGSRPG